MISVKETLLSLRFVKTENNFKAQNNVQKGLFCDILDLFNKHCIDVLKTHQSIFVKLSNKCFIGSKMKFTTVAQTLKNVISIMTVPCKQHAYVRTHSFFHFFRSTATAVNYCLAASSRGRLASSKTRNGSAPATASPSGTRGTSRLLDPDAKIFRFNIYKEIGIFRSKF